MGAFADAATFNAGMASSSKTGFVHPTGNRSECDQWHWNVRLVQNFLNETICFCGAKARSTRASKKQETQCRLRLVENSTIPSRKARRACHDILCSTAASNPQRREARARAELLVTVPALDRAVITTNGDGAALACHCTEQVAPLETWVHP